MTGVLRIQTTKSFGESTVSKSSNWSRIPAPHKSKSEKLHLQIRLAYTPRRSLRRAGAGGSAARRPVDAGASGAVGRLIYRALTFLVISCPCALVISIPLSFFAGIGGASKEGVLD